jgi:tetratricopeptide (TPR) repeat protein
MVMIVDGFGSFFEIHSEETNNNITMSSYNRALDLNNRGAALIQLNDFSAAISLLTQAHGFAKASLRETSNNRRDEESSSTVRSPPSQHHHSQHHHGPRRSAIDSIMCQNNRTPTHQNQQRPQDGDVFIYRHPIHIQSREGGSLQERSDASVILSMAVVFNLGLAHHLKGNNISLTVSSNNNNNNNNNRGSNERREDQVSIYRTAIMLYHFAFRLHMTIDSSKRGRPSFLLTLATTNNAGQLHRQMNENAKARQCFEKVLSIVTQLRRGRDQVQVWPDLDGFAQTSQWVEAERRRISSSDLLPGSARAA